jgi:hypothetical protein
VLIALMVMLFYGSSGGANAQLGELTHRYMKAEVKAAIPDETRRELALKALSGLTDDIAEMNGRLQKDLAQFGKLVQDYDSRPDDFDQLFEARSVDHLRRVDRIWARRAAMLEHVRPEEWNIIIQGARAAAAKEAASAAAKKPAPPPNAP